MIFFTAHIRSLSLHTFDRFSTPIRAVVLHVEDVGNNFKNYRKLQSLIKSILLTRNRNVINQLNNLIVKLSCMFSAVRSLRTKIEFD